MITELTGLPVLVTGAAGFIGSHLVKRLLCDGAVVHALDVPSADWQRLDDSGNMARHGCDLTDRQAVASVVSDITPVKIYHLAACTNVQRGLEMLDASLDDLAATLNVVRALPGSPCDCMVVTGTCEEYGDSPAPFREDMVPRAVSAYSAAKGAAVTFADMFARTMELPLVMLRPFLTYGPGQGINRFIPSAIMAALCDETFPMTAGEQTREFNYVDDIVDGFVRASITPEAIGEIINLGNGEEHTLRAVVELISHLAGKPLRADFGALPYRKGETWHFYCDNTKARELLGWSPEVGLEEGLYRTIEACRETMNEG